MGRHNDFLAVEHTDTGTLKNVARPSDVATKYTLPAGGIPQTDLSSAVQTKLDNGGTIADGSITNAKISSTAAIDKSKLAALNIGDSDINTISPSKITGTAVITTDTRLAKANSAVQTVNSKTPTGGDVTLTKADLVLGSVDNTTDLGKPISTATQTALTNGLATKIDTSQRGAVSGVATLDTNTTLTAAQLPANVIIKSTNAGDAGKAIDAYTGAPLVVSTGTTAQTKLAPVASGAQATSSVNGASGTYLGSNMRKSHQSPSALSDLQITWANFYNNNGQEADANVGDVTVRASVEYPSGTYTPVFFNGKRDVTINPGGSAESDPVAVQVPAGVMFWTRTYMSLASTSVAFPIFGPAVTASPYLEAAISETLASQDKTTSGTISGGGYGFPPVRIRGKVPGNTLVIAAVGDSILNGAGDSGVDVYRGYLGIATAGIVPVQKVTLTSNRAIFEAAASGRYRRWRLLDGCNAAIEELAINDLANTRTLAQLQADKITIWQALVTRGMKVWATTVLPQATSTDAFATTANQTPRAWEATRTALNDWLRDGAPIASTASIVAVATGTSGALRAGTTGHPLTGYIELADLLEVNSAGTLTRNGGRWRVDLGTPTADGTHPTTVLHQALAPAVTAVIPAIKTATGSI